MDIANIINQGESLKVEFKMNFNRSAIETLVAFSNTKGGSIFVGVSDDGDIKGIEVNQETIQQWINEVKNKTAPEIIPDAEVLNIEDKEIVRIYVQEYPIKPVSTQGRYFKRINNSNHQLAPGEVANMHLRSLNTSWDNQMNSEISIDDISLEKVQRAIEKLKSKGKNISEDPLSFLLKQSLIRDDKPTIACYLLFKNKDCILSTVELGFFQDEITIKDSDRSKSDLLSQVEEVISFVRKHINKEIIITGEPENTEKWQYPLEALREIIMNMIVHRDYQSSADSIVKVFPDKIEFYNPGQLPEDITIENLLSNNYSSIPRNKLIADFCKDLGLIEKYGSGIRRVVDYFKLENLPMPEFKNFSGGFKVSVFTNNKDIKTKTSFTQEPLVKLHSSDNNKITDRVTDKVIDRVTDRVTDNQKKILDLMSQNNRITTSQIAIEVGISQRKIKENIRRLRELNLIARIGSAKGGYWEVK